MDLQLVVYLIMLAALMTAMIIVGRQQRKITAYQRLEELIASSPAVCYSCRQYGVIREPGIGNPDGVTLHVNGLQDHEFVEARLVYIPDELLR